MKLEFSRQFKKYSNIKFHENPSCGNEVVPCGQTEGWPASQTYSHTDRQTDMTKPVVAVRNISSATDC